MSKAAVTFKCDSRTLTSRCSGTRTVNGPGTSVCDQAASHVEHCPMCDGAMADSIRGWWTCTGCGNVFNENFSWIGRA